VQIDANLEVLDKDLVSESLPKVTKEHLIVPGRKEVGGSKTANHPLEKETQSVDAP
jgi:hypothetical protein